MPEMKSAWQIAAEKTDKLGSLSRDEQRRLKEQEYGAVAGGMAERFLASCDDRQLSIQLGKYRDEAREIVRKAVVRLLFEAISLASRSGFETVCKGVRRLYPDGEFETRLAAAADVFERYGRIEESLRAEVDKEGRDLLHRLRISGSAVAGIEIRARPEWQQKLDDLARPLAVELDDLRQRLLTGV